MNYFFDTISIYFYHSLAAVTFNFNSILANNTEQPVTKTP